MDKPKKKKNSYKMTLNFALQLSSSQTYTCERSSEKRKENTALEYSTVPAWKEALRKRRRRVEDKVGFGSSLEIHGMRDFFFPKH